MASEVSICNQALSWVGGELITSLDDNSKEAKVCKANYSAIRDAVLEAHDWTFAIGRYDLPAAATPPVNGYANAFPLPSEVLRVIDVNGGEDWRVEGNDVVTNETACQIRAVIRITDPNKFSSLFNQAFVARLAADLSIPISQSKTLQKQHYALYKDKLADAETADGMQGKSRRITSSWLRGSRHSGAHLAGPTVGSPGNNIRPKG